MSLLTDIINALLSLIKTQSKTTTPVRGVHDVSLIKEFEGLELKAYKDIVGVWTIGYGHTKTVHPNMVTTQKGAEALLRSDLAWVEAAINKNVTVELTQNQYDALASFIYNLGETNFKKSTLLKKLNAGDYKGAAAEFPKWNKAGGKVVRGLTRRRNAEMEKFNA